jgi:hypothetical protein
VFRRKQAPAPVVDALDVAARRRLDRFARRFDAIPVTDFMLFAGPTTPDGRLQAAMDAANEAMGPRLRNTAKGAVAEFVKAAQLRYAERFSVLELLGVGSNRASSADDRFRVFQSLERAVVALVLWNQLDDETRSALGGPWAELIEAAVAGE